EPKHVTLLNNLLLLLMEQLESSHVMPMKAVLQHYPPPKECSMFFEQISPLAMNGLVVFVPILVVSLNAGCPAAANSEHENILYLIVKALIQLHCPEAVLGLYIWCKEIFNRKYTWMKASVDCAAGRFESAGHEYLCILQSLSHNTNSEKKDLNKVKNGTNEQEILVTQLNGSDVSVNKHQIDVPLHSFLINQVVDCYVKVQNWSEAIKWAEFLGNVKFHQNGLSVQKANTNNNLSYIRKDLSDQLNEAKAGIIKLMKITTMNWPLQLDANQASLFLSASSYQFNKASSTLLRENVKFDPSDCYSSVLGFLLNWENIWLRMNQSSPTGKLQSAGENESSFDLLLNSISVISNYIKNSNLSNVQADQLAELNSRSMLNLVKYIQHETKMNSSDNSELHSSKDAAWHFLLKNTINDMKPLDLSNLCKHFESVFASWCYGHGRKVVNSACNGSLSILSEEKEKILALIPNAHKEDTDVLLGIITSLHNASGSEWDNQEMDYTESGAEEIRWQLMTYCPFLLKLENQETIIENIIEIWKGLVTRAYSYYRIAAVSYLQYLKLNGKCADKEKTEDDNLTATLRILRLIIKHASELRDVLEDGLAETPTAPWRGKFEL
ncbi:hypothetical protein CEXT_276051, partial [Caerostris extrusa]